MDVCVCVCVCKGKGRVTHLAKLSSSVSERTERPLEMRNLSSEPWKENNSNLVVSLALKSKVCLLTCPTAALYAYPLTLILKRFYLLLTLTCPTAAVYSN